MNKANDVIKKISKGLYDKIPEDDNSFVEMCDSLIKERDMQINKIVTNWIKKRDTIYNLKYMKIYMKWLFEEVDNWGACDILCYRVLNPMIERFPCLYEEIIKWTSSDKQFVRRAAAVSLLHSSRTFEVNVPFEMVEEVAERLIGDTSVYVQNGVGWLLKYSYIKYPKMTVDYIMKTIGKMNSRTFNYAIEKFDNECREEMKKIRNSYRKIVNAK